MLGDHETHKKFQKDPTLSLQRKMNQKLKRDKERSRCTISYRVHQVKFHAYTASLKSTSRRFHFDLLSRFKTLPTYKLSDHLTGLVENTSSTVKISSEFAEFITTQRLQHGECLVSFKVVSLFSSVPVTTLVA
jgi:hypothetical protein